jgi:YidC/Oxa1 family membrane protein insertase
MEKRTLIAIVLSFVVFFGYTKAISVLYPDYGKKKTISETQAPGNLTDSSKDASPMNASTISGGMVQGSSAAVSSNEAKDERAAILLPLIALEYSNNRASFTDVKFTQYPDGKGGAYPFIKAASGKAGAGNLDVLLVDGAQIAPLEFKTTREARNIYSNAANDKIKIEKNWSLSGDAYGQAMSIAVTNTSDAPIRFRYRLLTGSGIVVHNSIDTQYIEANWLTAEKLKHVTKPGINKPKSSSDPALAASIKNRHFSSVFKPLKTDGTFTTHVEAYDKMDFGSYLVRSEVTIAPGQTITDSFLWYAGPNRVEDMMPYNLERLVNFGKLDFVAKIVLGGLHMIAGVVKNYGLAIILLTIATNILFMPLTKTSFMSMRRMQLVQPEANKLREKYKDNPTKLNTATMELYKKHKVNPMGGCLPMLLQMPIFMGLYVSLSKAPELLGGKFLWVNDLASPDQVYLPFALPVIGNSIHLLPIIMVGAMVIQMRMSSASMPAGNDSAAKQQKMMMTVMPIVFGFIFYPMPSGLVIYWLTNTLATSGYQAYLKKSNPIVTDIVSAS